MEKLEVTILPEDFKNAPNGYVSPRCVLETALKRIYPGKYTYVSAHTATIGNHRYDIDTAEWGHGGSPTGFSCHAINDLSQLAKESLDSIPTKTLYLQPI